MFFITWCVVEELAFAQGWKKNHNLKKKSKKSDFFLDLNQIFLFKSDFLI